MLRLKFWIGGALVALAATGMAMAAHPGATTTTASATFSATAKRIATRTCAGADGTYKITRGVFIGKMESSDARLNGPVQIKLESYYNTDESAGWMSGLLRLRNGDTEAKTEARLTAVNLDGTVEGILIGHGKSPRAKLLANFSAEFTPDGFENGKLGTGGSLNQTLFFGGACRKDDSASEAKRDAKPESTPERTEKKPTVTSGERPEKDSTR